MNTRHPGSRPADRLRHALRRPRHRQPEDLCAQRQENPHRNRSRPKSTRTSRWMWRSSAICAKFCRSCCRASRRATRPRMARVHPRASRVTPPSATFRTCPTMAISTPPTSSTTSGTKPAMATTIIVTDVGQHQMWEAQYYKHEHPALAHHLRRPRHHGIRAARRHRRQGRPSGCGRLGRRRRWRLPDDHVRARHHRAGESQGQHRHHQQRLPGHGPPVAGIFLRQELRSHAAPQPRLQKARRGLRHPQLRRASTAPTWCPRFAPPARTMALC